MPKPLLCVKQGHVIAERYQMKIAQGFKTVESLKTKKQQQKTATTTK